MASFRQYLSLGSQEIIYEIFEFEAKKRDLSNISNFKIPISFRSEILDFYKKDEPTLFISMDNCMDLFRLHTRLCTAKVSFDLKSFLINPEARTMQSRISGHFGKDFILVFEDHTNRMVFLPKSARNAVIQFVYEADKWAKTGESGSMGARRLQKIPIRQEKMRLLLIGFRDPNSFIYLLPKVILAEIATRFRIIDDQVEGLLSGNEDLESFEDYQNTKMAKIDQLTKKQKL
jgi:hypothetical protein